MRNQKYFTLSNLLSFSRLLLIIPVWIFFDYFPDQKYRYFVVASGIIAVVTDVLDGYFARKYDAVTEIGKVIDPLADKILVGVVIFRLYLLGEIPDYYLALILGRDLLILAGGMLIATKTKFVLPSDYLGKATVLAVTIVMLLILLDIDKDNIYFNAIYFLSILLIIVSFSNYAVKAIRLKRKN